MCNIGRSLCIERTVTLYLICVRTCIAVEEVAVTVLHYKTKSVERCVVAHALNRKSADNSVNHEIALGHISGVCDVSDEPDTYRADL